SIIERGACQQPRCAPARARAKRRMVRATPPLLPADCKRTHGCLYFRASRQTRSRTVVDYDGRFAFGGPRRTGLAAALVANIDFPFVVYGPPASLAVSRLVDALADSRSSVDR